MQHAIKLFALLTLISCSACTSETSTLSTTQTQQICDEAKNVICDYWDDFFSIDDCNVSVDSIQKNDTGFTMKFSVTLDRTYTTPPEEMPDIIGMQRAVQEITDPAQRGIAQSVLDGQLAERQGEYNTTVDNDRYNLIAEISCDNTQDFAYTIYFLKQFGKTVEKYELTQFFSEELPSPEEIEQNGYHRVYEIVAQQSP